MFWHLLQAQISEYKFEIERLARELQDTKKRYFDQKKKEQVARERDRAIQDTSMRVWIVL